MIKVKKEGIVLEKTELEFENEGVLNPAVILDNGLIHLFYRALRKGNNSTIGYCNLKNPMHVNERSTHPLIVPEFDYESKGVEDPRISKIDGVYYLTFTAYDEVNALGALALSEDLINFKKQGLIVPSIHCDDFLHYLENNTDLIERYQEYNFGNHLVWNKNIIFFPRRINNKLYFFQRIRPDIQLVSVNNLGELTKEFWDKYFQNFKENIVLSSRYKHEERYIGGGSPPIETKEGWLIIYHSVEGSGKGKTYSACAALLDLNDPRKEIARLPYSLFKPEYQWELKGEVNNVCFPTGTALFNDTLFIYYGAADERIACASVSLSALIDELLLYSE